MNSDYIYAALEQIGMYPKAIIGGDNAYEERTEYMEGWNNAAMTLCERITDALDAMDEDEENRDIQLLLSSGYVEYGGNEKYILNMSDVWCWACADAEYIEKKEIPEVTRLFKEYGWPGLLYWASQKNGGIYSEFTDNNRFIEFVENEERVKEEVPDYNKRAYHKVKYTIGKR